MLRNLMSAGLLCAVMALPAAAQDKKKEQPKGDDGGQGVYVVPFEGFEGDFAFDMPKFDFSAPDMAFLADADGEVFWTHRGGYLGVILVRASADSAKEQARGAEVGKVIGDSPAAKGGLKDRDVIVAVDGKAVGSGREFLDAMRETKPDQKVTLDVLRNGKRESVSVTLASRPEPRVFVGKFPGDGGQFWHLGNRARLGVSVMELTDQLREYFNVEKGKGVLVSSVEEGSAASKAGMRAGDVIVSIGGKDVAWSGDLVNELRRVEEKSQALDVGVVRDRSRQNFSVTVELPESKVNTWRVPRPRIPQRSV